LKLLHPLKSLTAKNDANWSDIGMQVNLLYTVTYTISGKASFDLHLKQIIRMKRILMDTKKGKLIYRQTREEIEKETINE